MHSSPSRGFYFLVKEPRLVHIRSKIGARHGTVSFCGKPAFGGAKKLLEEVCGHGKGAKGKVLHTEEVCGHVTMLAQAWEV